VTLILDTGPLVGLADAAEPRFGSILRSLEHERGDLIIPCPVTAEVDYLLSERFGALPQERFVADISSGTYRAECLSAEEHGDVLRLMRQYRDPRVPALPTFSVVVLAARFHTTRILVRRTALSRQRRLRADVHLLPLDDDGA
jgi:hypothetical protein